MGPNSVLFRTPKAEALLTGTGHEITHNQRNALIVVDGKTTIEHLAQKAFWVTDFAKIMDELYAMGLVTDHPETIDLTALPPDMAHKQLKNEFIGLAEELLGASAARIIPKFEETDGSPGALEQALLSCKKIIKLTISEELAETFLERGRKLLGK